jgi:hypothetical protein
MQSLKSDLRSLNSFLKRCALATARRRQRSNLAASYVEFVRLLFAVVVTQSFVLLTTQYAGWFLSVATISENFVQIATLFLSYVLVTTSWIGYHIATDRFPYEWKRINPRFFIDVILLFLYYLAFAEDQTFWVVMLIYAVVYSLYIVWDSFTLWEYRESSSDLAFLRKRPFESSAFAICFWLIFLVSLYWSSFPEFPYLMIFPLILMVYFRTFYPTKAQ